MSMSEFCNEYQCAQKTDALEDLEQIRIENAAFRDRINDLAQQVEACRVTAEWVLEEYGPHRTNAKWSEGACSVAERILAEVDGACSICGCEPGLHDERGYCHGAYWKSMPFCSKLIN